MKNKTIERLITCVVLVLLSYAVCGCKDEVEANDMITDITIEAFGPNENIDWGNIVFLEIALLEEPNFADSDRIYLYEGDDFDIVIEKKKPPEPNEPPEPITSIHISMISDDFEEFNKIYIGTDSEIKEALLKDGVIAKPNEPDLTFDITGGDLTLTTPNEPNEPLCELAKLFEQVLDQEGRLINIIRIYMERTERLEKMHEPLDPNLF